MKKTFIISLLIFGLFTTITDIQAQIGRRFPSERKVIFDPVTGNKLIFLTSTPAGDSKIYQTHNQWTSDGKWLIFRSGRVKGEAMAVNESSGEMVQVSEGGYMGMLNVARKSMKLYFMRKQVNDSLSGTLAIVEVDLAKLFTDSKAGKLKPAHEYQRVCGITTHDLQAGGDMALDGNEEWVWFRVGKGEAQKHLSSSVKIEPDFGPRKMGAGPAGIAGMKDRKSVV